jgi:hypothetical protein
MGRKLHSDTRTLIHSKNSVVPSEEIYMGATIQEHPRVITFAGSEEPV